MMIFKGHGAARPIAVSITIATRMMARMPPYGRTSCRMKVNMRLGACFSGTDRRIFANWEPRVKVRDGECNRIFRMQLAARFARAAGLVINQPYRFSGGCLAKEIL